MRIVIVGGGKVGFSLATQLAKENHDIVLVDNSRQVLKKLGEMLDIMLMYGNGATLSALREANVEESDLLIAATAKDELNMLCCLTARKLGCPNTIARVRSAEYKEQLIFLKDEMGLSMTINPEWSAAREIFRLMQIPAFLKRDSFAKGRAEIVEIEIRAGSVLDGMQLSDMHRKVKVRVLVCAVHRGTEIFIPGGSFQMMAGDRIYVTAPTTDLAALVAGLGMRNKKTKDVLIIGGSKIAQYLTHMLLRAGTRVKLIEMKPEHSLQLAEMFPAAVIINADGTSQTVLKAENIEKMDTVVTLTDMDEENLIVSMYANYLGVPQVITKINRTEYSEVFEDKGIECVISPKQLCTNDVIRYVRAMQNTVGDSVITVHYLVDDKVEALEFEVTKKTRNVGVTLKDISLKPNILVACINRRGRIIIPGGADMMEMGDTVIVVTSAERVIIDLNDIFAENLEE